MPYAGPALILQIDAASGLGIAPGTVACAHRELEYSGTAVTGGRHVTRVAESADPPNPVAGEEHVSQAAESFVTTAIHPGVAMDDAIQAVRAAFNPAHSTKRAST